MKPAILAALLLLTGCAVQPRYYGPPPMMGGYVPQGQNLAMQWALEDQAAALQQIANQPRYCPPQHHTGIDFSGGINIMDSFARGASIGRYR